MDLNAGDGIQIGVVVVLTLTLGAVLCYAWQARRQALASVRMVEEMREQRLSMSQPVVVPKPLQVHSMTGQHNIRLTLTNVGNGPAISLRRTGSHPSLKVASGSTEHSQKWPILLMNEEQDMSFVLGHPVDAADAQLEVSWKDIHDQQFTLTAPMKWKESGQMELGDMDFRVVKGDG